MAGDWIKMRPSLLTSPKVNGMAKFLENHKAASHVLTTGFSGYMSEIVTRNVMRNVTVASLLTVWGAANEHTSDGVFTNAELSDIDDMVGVPGFGEAMASVGWAIYDEENYTVTLPNFNEYNTCGRDRAKEKNAERQRRYREKHKADSNDNSNVTNDVTSNDREEKRREEEKEPCAPSARGDSNTLADRFAKFWMSYPKKKSRGEAEKAWKAIKPSEQLLQTMLDAIERAKTSEQWQKDGGQFIPYPATWLRAKGWEDDNSAPQPDRPWYETASGITQQGNSWGIIQGHSEPFPAFRDRVFAEADKRGVKHAA